MDSGLIISRFLTACDAHKHEPRNVAPTMARYHLGEVV
jgi:hypothetical protein